MEEIATQFVWFLKQCRTWGPPTFTSKLDGWGARFNIRSPTTCCFTPITSSLSRAQFTRGEMLLDQLCKKLIRKSKFWCEALKAIYMEIFNCQILDNINWDIW